MVPFIGEIWHIVAIAVREAAPFGRIPKRILEEAGTCGGAWTKYTGAA